MKRMWINQPSTLQPFYRLHGTNVLAAPDGDVCHRVWFLSGDTISQQVLNNALSDGWVTKAAPTPDRISELEAKVNALVRALPLLREGATLVQDLTNGYAARELHTPPESWRAEVEEFMNQNGDTLED